MGGVGSGTWYRWDKRPVLDDCRCIDINRMVKLGAISENSYRQGNWQWINSYTGKEVSNIGYECNTLDFENSFIRFFYTITDSQEKIDFKVQLSRSKAHYGGYCFWFICPRTNRRVTKLYKVYSDENHFVSRHVFKLNYRSQMEGDVDRAIAKKWKLMEKLDGHHYPIRPKGMHHKTFEWIYEEFERQDEQCMLFMYRYVEDMKEKYKL